MNGWGLGLMRGTGLVWGNGELLGSELGCERVRARRWHEPLLARLQQGPAGDGAATTAWFAAEVLPWIRKQAAKGLHRGLEALWLRYADDVQAETEACVRFLLGGSQIFRITAHLQHREDFLDVDRVLTLPDTLPYRSFFLALERHPAFAVWDDVRAPEFVDGCFVNELSDGSLHLFFTLRGDQASSGLPGVGVHLPKSGGDMPTTIRAWVTRCVQASEPALDAPPLPELTSRWQRERELAMPVLQRQTAAREHAIACAVNRVLKLLDLLTRLQRQDAALSVPGLSPRTRAQLQETRTRSMPAAPRAVELMLTPVSGMPFGVGHFRATSTVAPHWRRSHWRYQPCGSGREQRRLVRIESTQVGHAVPLESGRNYAVRQ